MPLNLMSGIENYDPANTPGLSGIAESGTIQNNSAKLTNGSFLDSFMPSSTNSEGPITVENLLPTDARESAGMERAVQVSPERQGSQGLQPVNYPTVGKLDLLLAIVGGPQSVQLLAQRRNQNIAGPVIVDFTPKFDAAIRSGDLQGANKLLQQLAIVSPNNPILFDLYKRSADIMVKVQDKVFSNQAAINVLKTTDDGTDPAKTKVLAAMQANVTNMTDSQLTGLMTKMFPKREERAGLVRQISEITAKQIGTTEVLPAAAEADKYSREKQNAIQTETGLDPTKYAEYENKLNNRLLSPEAEEMHRANVEKVNKKTETNIGLSQLSAKDQIDIAADPDAVSDLLKGNKGTKPTETSKEKSDFDIEYAALMAGESNASTRDNYKSPKGAIGKSQILLETARKALEAPDLTEAELMNPAINKLAGRAEYARLKAKFNNNGSLAASAYYTGEGNVKDGKIVDTTLQDGTREKPGISVSKYVANFEARVAAARKGSTRPTNPAATLAQGKTDVEATRVAATRRAGNIADWQSKDVGEIGGQYGANIDKQGNMVIVKGEEGQPVTGEAIKKAKAARVTPASPVGHIVTTHSEVKEPISIAIKAMLKIPAAESKSFTTTFLAALANGFDIPGGVSIRMSSAISEASPAYQDAVAKANIALSILTKSVKSDNFGLSTGVINGTLATGQSAVIALRAIERGLDGATRGALRQLGAEVPARESQEEEDARERPTKAEDTSKPVDIISTGVRRKK